MANHTRGPRGRSRKPRPRSAESRPVDDSALAVQGDGAAREARTGRPRAAARDRARSAGGRRGTPAYRAFDERPRAPWHPLPLSELVILAGGVAFVVAMLRLSRHGLGSGGPLLLAAVLAIGLGTAEVSWREHRSGFRSHTLLLAFVPVLVLHTAVVLGLSTLVGASRTLNFAMLAVDLVVFAVLARHLRGVFLDARARR